MVACAKRLAIAMVREADARHRALVGGATLTRAEKRREQMLKEFARIARVEEEARRELDFALAVEKFDTAVGLVDVLSRCAEMKSSLLLKGARSRSKKADVSLASQAVH
jgi:hypothetical protein